MPPEQTDYDPLAHALQLAKSFRVFPIEIYGDVKDGTARKSPLTPKAPVREGGFKFATQDPDEIRRLFRKKPWRGTYRKKGKLVYGDGTPGEHAVGIVTGPSHIGVLDCDVKKVYADGNPINGCAVADAAGLGDTWTVKTPSGGEHRYFRLPDDCPRLGNTNPWAGCDWRSHKGYVVAPGVHSERFGGGWTVVDDSVPIRTLPEDSLVALLRAQQGNSEALAWLVDHGYETKKPKSTKAKGANTNSGVKVQVGNRNNHLTSRGGMLRSRGLDEPEILDALRGINGGFEEPLGDTEVQSIARSVAGYEAGGEMRSYEKFKSKILTLRDLELLPEPEAIIEGMLFENSLAALVASYGSLKTFAAISWVGAITTGTSWFGREVMHGKVLYVVAEGGANIWKRFAAWRRDAGLAIDNERLHFYPEPIDFANLDMSTNAVKYAHEFQPSLIVVDTLARCMDGLDENSSKDTALVIRHADALRRASNACVLLVHHFGKDETKGLRGSTALPGAIDTAITLRRNKKGKTLTMESEKSKDHRPFERIELGWTEVGDSLVLTCAPNKLFHPGVPSRGFDDSDIPKARELLALGVDWEVLSDEELRGMGIKGQRTTLLRVRKAARYIMCSNGTSDGTVFSCNRVPSGSVESSVANAQVSADVVNSSVGVPFTVPNGTSLLPRREESSMAWNVCLTCKQHTELHGGLCEACRVPDDEIF